MLLRIVQYVIEISKLIHLRTPRHSRQLYTSTLGAGVTNCKTLSCLSSAHLTPSADVDYQSRSASP